MGYPGGSKKRVNRAGDRVRDHDASAEDYLVIQQWRAAHRLVLNNFQAILRNRAKGTKARVAQRLKRRATIFDKLHRFPEMQLARMDDIAGCRVIFRSLKELDAFRRKVHRARFDHHLKHDPDKYDYIKRPKPTGYRGIHDIYTYCVNSSAADDLNGLNVEIQYRTIYQHAWATAVEIVGSVTQSQPKFQRGDGRITQLMSFASEIIARAHERMVGPHADMDDEEVVRNFVDLDHELGIMKSLKALGKSGGADGEYRNYILESDLEGNLAMYQFRDATEALKRLFEMEVDRPGHDIVLVRADSSDDVKFAFRNYFNDARDFIRLVDAGCAKLSGKQRAIRKKRK